VLELPALDSLPGEQRLLRAALARLRGKLRWQLALEFAADAVTALAATAALLVLFDWWFRFGLPVRMLLLLSSLAAILAFLGTRAIWRWRASKVDDLALAMAVDRFRPGTAGQIADVLQLPDLLRDQAASASPAMVRLAVRQACEALAQSDWRSLWNRKRTSFQAGALLLGLLVPAVFAWWAPQAARLSVARWFLGSAERWPQKTYLTVTGLDDAGRILAPRDERFWLEVRSDLPTLEPFGDRWIVRGRGEPMVWRSRPKSLQIPESVVVKERTAQRTSREGAMVAMAPAQFRYELPPESASSTFRLVGGDDWLGPFTLERVDRPTLAATRLQVKEPGATYAGFRNIEDPRRHLLFLPDTEVDLTLVGNEQLSDTQLKVQAGSKLDLKRLDDRTFAAHWTLREATTLEIILTAARTGLASRPTFLSIGLLRDREPRVTLRALGVGSHVTPIATIPLNIGATDDFGLAALRLQVERTLRSDEKTQSVPQRQTVAMPLPSGGDRPVLDHQARQEILLQADPPPVGTLLRFLAEADDRCARGAQTGRSSALQLQVVSPDELFYEILIRQRAERAKFLAVIESLEKQTPVLAGEPRADDFLRVMRLEHAGARQVDQIAGRIADALQEMKLNQIGSAKSHRLLQEAVIDPLRALAAGPMNELRGMLQALAGAGSSPGATEEAARRLHGQVVTTMRNILEQMSQWESFVDVVNQVAEVIKMEKNVLQATEKARDTRTREVFDDKP
jgi:hypothetical protein